MPAPAFPAWLHVLAFTSLGVGLVCAALIAMDEVRHPQGMWIMNLVWPLTALFGGLLWLALYAFLGRTGGRTDRPSPAAVAKATSHCGAGCTLGDLIAETWAALTPGIAVAFGWKSLFADKTFAVWILDFVLAFLFGVAFQYFTIQPMKKLSPAAALVQALKADAASIAAWQVGMYGAMALIQFGLWRPLYGATASPVSPEFWFAMQLAMLAGFLTACPANWVLLRIGVKEPM